MRREVPSLQDVMDEAVLRRAEIDEERERVRRERRNAMGSYAGYGDEENEMDAPHLTREELEESKRKSLVMTQLLDSIFNNYDMYIRPGFQECKKQVQFISLNRIHRPMASIMSNTYLSCIH